MRWRAMRYSRRFNASWLSWQDSGSANARTRMRMNTSLAGFAADDPARGRRLRVNAADAEGAGLGLGYGYRPGVGPDATGHVHESWTETFEILDGSAKYRVGS